MSTAERSAAPTVRRAGSLGPARALVAQSLRDARVRTIAFVYLFAAYAYIQPVGYRSAYPSAADRLRFADGFAKDKGLRLLYGEPYSVATANGYVAWRVGGVLAIAAAGFGVLAATRALRADEDAGRMELVLAGLVGRRTVSSSSLLAVAAGVLLLWLAELLGFVVGGLPIGGSAYLALATVSVAAVFVGVGAVASQLAPTRRIALGLGGAIVGVAFLLRVLADTLDGARGLRWATPLGWAEELHPFAGARPLVLVLPVAATGALVAVAVRLAAERDVGTGLLPAREAREPNLRLLSSPTAQALRAGSGVLAAWIAGVAAFTFVLGTIAKSISSADVPASAQKQIAKLGAGSITTPTGYLGFVFLFVVVAVCVFACAQVGGARQAEVDEWLQALLAQLVARRTWLGGRLLLAVTGAATISLTAGLCAWAGADVAGAGLSLPRMLEAGANALPVSVLFLGVAALAYALVPRASAGIAYGLLTLAFLWQLVGSLLGPPRWVLDLTPFAHVGLVPAESFRPAAAAVMVAIGVATAAAAIVAFRRRDLLGG